jgi:uncharacterized damage-inducible protein DinB
LIKSVNDSNRLGKLMTELYKQIVLGQFEAALAMFRQCVSRCPEANWDDKIANYTFRQVAYHTLFFADFYLSTDEASFQLRDLHRRGGDLRDSHQHGDEREPCPGLSKEEALTYTEICHAKLVAQIAAETAETLADPSGIDRRKITRAELHLYNMRHVQHHVGGMSAFLRKLGVDLDWIGRGWAVSVPTLVTGLVSGTAPPQRTANRR